MKLFITILALALPITAYTQKVYSHFNGQANTWMGANHNTDNNAYTGIRYLPQVNAKVTFDRNTCIGDSSLYARNDGAAGAFTVDGEGSSAFTVDGEGSSAFTIDGEGDGSAFTIDAEIAVNASAERRFGKLSDPSDPSDPNNTNANAKLYRTYVRIANVNNELRIGLQKINFGSAQLLRPLMWFDQLQPNDPLKLTNGVNAILYKHYTQNNTNLWAWILYGNKGIKGLETTPVKHNTPELGARAQIPIPRGEAAIAYHTRNIDASASSATHSDREHRLGLDAKVDVEIGLWVEATANFTTHNSQQLITLGADYTLNIGNGLTATAEHLLANFNGMVHYTAIALNYNINAFHNLSTLTFYDYLNKHIYNFIQWKYTANYLTLYAIAHNNPNNYNLPGNTNTQYFTGNGVQVMIVWNH